MIRAELTRQLKRVWTWVGFAGLAALPIVIAIATRNDRPDDFNLFAFGVLSGPNHAVLSLLVMHQFFLIVVTALFSGAAIAGEGAQGTLRYLLIRPVSRVRLVLSKLFVIVGIVTAATFTISLAGLASGSVAFGWRDSVLPISWRRLDVDLVPPWEAVGRLSVATAYVALMMVAIVALGLFLSTLSDSPAGAVVGTIGITVTCQILSAIPSLKVIRPVLLNQYLQEWTVLFRGQSTEDMWKGVTSAVVYATIFTVLALVRFQFKDIKS